jgi:integrase
VLDAYVAGREGISETTRQNYQNRVAHIKKILGNLRLADLTSGQIERCKRELDWLDASTKAAVFVLLRAALKAAVLKRLIRTNPTDDVELPAKERKVRPHAHSPADIAELLSHLIGHETWLPAAVMAYTGMRHGEVCALRRSSIYFDRSEIDVRASVQRLKRELIVGPPKTENSARRIAITEDLAEALREHFAEQERIGRELGLAPSPDWFVFLPPKGRWEPTKPRCPSALCEAIQWRLRSTASLTSPRMTFATRMHGATTGRRQPQGRRRAPGRYRRGAHEHVCPRANRRCGTRGRDVCAACQRQSGKKWQGPYPGRAGRGTGEG